MVPVDLDFEPGPWFKNRFKKVLLCNAEKLDLTYVLENNTAFRDQTKTWYLCMTRQEPLKLPGQCSYLKNLKTPFFGEYFKFLVLSNSHGSKTPPQIFFFEIISTNRAARGFQSFGLIEGAAVLPSKQWPKFLCQISAVIWWTYAENF